MGGFLLNLASDTSLNAKLILEAVFLKLWNSMQFITFVFKIQLVISGYVSSGDSLSLDKLSLSATSCAYLPANAVPVPQTTYTTSATTTVKQFQPSTSGGMYKLIPVNSH